ncbi:MAG TPA: hypothetical protein DCY98_10070 [Nitrospinae bacterium]|nr:hypothetical protein [Nitrospinota bacterium]
MPLFEIKKRKATKINQREFKDESELHCLIDENLEELFGIRYIKDEHITDKHGRIETLGLDESNRPVVIEYKKTKEKGQLVQANRYITWVKQNPDSFELLAKNNLKNINGQIDFENPRIICFAQEYSIDDKCLALSLGAELWKYRYYDNDTLTIIREEEPEQLINSTGNKNYTIEKIKNKPRKPKTVEDHLNGSSKELIKVFEQFNGRVLDISSEIEQYTTADHILYKTSVNFIALAIQKKKDKLKISLRTIDDKIDDPKKLTERVPKRHGWGNMTRTVYLAPSELSKKKYSLDDIIDLVLQSYHMTQ